MMRVNGREKRSRTRRRMRGAADGWRSAKRHFGIKILEMGRKQI